VSDKGEKTNYDRTVDIVRDALPRMSELKIPITPNNYAVWYEYLTNANQALREEMDALLEGASPITHDDMRQLYERYLEERSEKLRAAKEAFGQMFNALINHISQADNQYNNFSTEMNEIANGLEGDISTENLNSLIDRAMKATRAALEHGTELKKNLSSLANEIEDVRGKLLRTQEEARTDALTGLYNRLAFQEELAKLPEFLTEDTHPPCLMIIDIDYFKRVNDTHGHSIGDLVLQRVAQEIKGSVRGRDMVVRHGGEEFAVLLRDTPRSGCQAAGENLRANVQRTVIELSTIKSKEKSLSVTISIGGAWYRENEPSENFVDRADRSLYLSKQHGRNRVTWENQGVES